MFIVLSFYADENMLFFYQIVIETLCLCRSLNVDAIIRGGLRRYTDQLGHLWNSLADYYVRSGLFERVRLEWQVSPVSLITLYLF